MDTTITTPRLRRLTQSGRYRLLALAMLAGSAGLAGCEDDPVDTHGEEHAEGFAMYSGGVQIYNYQEDLNAGNPDTLHLVSGQTYNVTIVWLDHDGEAIELDGDLEPEVSVTSPGVANWTVTGESSGTLVAASVASPVETTMRVALLHGGHEDFDSGFFTVRVAP